MMNDTRNLLDDILRLQSDTHILVRRLCAANEDLVDSVTELAAKVDDIKSRLSALERSIGNNVASCTGSFTIDKPP
jgi:hypothetical protein